MNNLFTVEIDKETTLEELFGEHKNDIEIVLNEKYIPTDDWCKTYVKPNDILLVYLLPKGGGGGNKVIRTVLMIAVVAAVAVSQQYYLVNTLAGFAPGTMTLGQALVLAPGAVIAATAISVGIIMTASWALYQIFPDPKPKDPGSPGDGAQGQEETSLSSSKNAPAPYAPLSKMYGIKRVKPVLAATPDVNLNGNDQVVSCLYFLNHGPISIRKGNTEYYIGNNNYKVIHKPSAYVSNCSQLIDFSSMSNLDDYGYDNQSFARISDTSLQALKDADQYFKFVVGTPRALLEAYPQLNTDKVLEQIDYVFNPYDKSELFSVNKAINKELIIDLKDYKYSQYINIFLNGSDIAVSVFYQVENDQTWYHFPLYLTNPTTSIIKFLGPIYGWERYYRYLGESYYDPELGKTLTFSHTSDAWDGYYEYWYIYIAGYNFKLFSETELNAAKTAYNLHNSNTLIELINSTNPLYGESIIKRANPILGIHHILDKTKKLTKLKIKNYTYEAFNGGGTRKPTISSIQCLNQNSYLGGTLVNSSAVNPYSIELHLYADQGLYRIDSNNNAYSLSIPFRFSAWVEGYDDKKIETIINLEGNSKNPVRKTISLPYEGTFSITTLQNLTGITDLSDKRIEFNLRVDDSFQYQSGEYHSSTIVAKFIETTQNMSKLKEIRKANGTISQEKYYVLGGLSSNIDILDHSVVAWLQVSANNVLRGTIDSFDICFGGLVEDKTSPKYNTPFGESYHYILSLNPAEIFIDILTQKGIVKPVPLTRIDMPELLEWRDWCNAFYNNKYTALPPISNRYYPSFEFSKYITDNTTVIQLLKEVTAAGLAKFTFKNGKFSIARDKANLLPVQMITPRNSWGFKAVKTLYKQPEAIRISYVSKKNWEQVETFVFLPGIDPTTKTKDIIEVQTTVPMEEYQAQRIGMMYLASTQLRSEVYTVSMDVEAISFEVGDLVILSYDTVAIGKSYGRISSIENTNGYWYISVDEPCPIDPTRSQSVLIRIFKNNMVQFISYIINPSISTSKKLAINTQTIDNISIGDLFTFGDTTTISIKCKVTNMQFDSNQNVLITLIEDAPAIHDIYLKDEYPTYTPIVSSEPNYNLLRTRPPKIISVSSGIF